MKKSNYISILLALLFGIAFFLRWYLMPQNLFFGPEQGRDLLAVRDIVVGNNLTLIGPKTALDGIFHGPLYYYLISIPFMLSGGSPTFIALFLVVINSLTIYVVYKVTKELLSARVALIAALLFAVSFEVITYARWLSHPPLVLPLSGLFFLFVYRFLTGSSRNLIYAAVVFGLLFQAELVNVVILVATVLLCLVVFRKRIFSQDWRLLSLSVIILLVVSLLPFVLFDLRHDYLIINNIFSIAQTGSAFHASWTETLVGINRAFRSVSARSVAPFYPVLGAILVLGGAVTLLRHRYKNNTGSILVAIWLFAPLLALFLFRFDALDHYLAFSVLAMIILAAVLVDEIITRSLLLGLLLLTLIVGANMSAYGFNIQDNSKIFFQSAQTDLKFADQLAVVDEVYENAAGRSFEVQAYTIPYWIQDAWEYLFWQYGEKKYGYGPVKEKSDVLFVIIQPDPSSQQYQDNWLKDTVDKWGELESSQEIGALALQTLIPN